MTQKTGGPTQDEIRREFLREMPSRLAAFERRIMRFRFEGWSPGGMVVLVEDLNRLADASERHGLPDAQANLKKLAQTIHGYVAGMRAPDPPQTTRLFALLTAVVKSLPSSHELPGSQPARIASETAKRQEAAAPVSADTQVVDAASSLPEAELQAAGTVAAEADVVPTPAAESVASAAASPFGTVEPVRLIESDKTIESSEPVALTVSVPAIETPDATAQATTHDVVEPTEPIEADRVEEVSASATIEADWVEDVAAGATLEADRIEEVVARATIETDRVEEAPASATIDTISQAEPAGPAEPLEPDEATPPIAPGESIALNASLESIEADELEEPETTGEGGVRRIYHLSDGNPSARALDNHLELEGYAVEPVDSLEELSELLMCLMPQVLMVDASHLSDLVAIGDLRLAMQKRSQPSRRIQLVVLAGQVDLQTRRLAHRAGVDLLLFPPFDVAVIAERLRALHASAVEQKVRVLIVEDDRTDALYAQTVLSRAGMQAQVEHDPLRVLEALKSLHPDLVLMDLHMPVANGVEVTLLIREDPVFARLPIVFLSGESDPDSQLEAIDAGGDDFLFKPIRPRQLIDAVRDRMRHMHRARNQGSAAAVHSDRIGLERQA